MPVEKDKKGYKFYACVLCVKMFKFEIEYVGFTDSVLIARTLTKSRHIHTI